MAPRITVCVPVYLGARFVAETLEAIRRQEPEAAKVPVAELLNHLRARLQLA